MSTLLDQIRATSPWEAAAMLTGLAYTLLAVRRNLWCWLCAFVSSAVYLVVFARQGLYMQSLLQVFYLVMAVYGFINWSMGRSGTGEVQIRAWALPMHVAAAVVVVAASVANGWFLEARTDAAAPYIDSFVTWGSVLTTWMVTRRVIENWLYWIVVDGVGVWLYYSQGLILTALLFLIYVGIVVHGYVVWRREQAVQRAAVAAAAASSHVTG